MSDPTKPDLSDWILLVSGAVLSGILAGLAAAMRWFTGSKREIYKRLKVVEDSMDTHSASLAVFEEYKRNTETSLADIKEATRDTNQSIKELGQTITQALLAMQAKEK